MTTSKNHIPTPDHLQHEISQLENLQRQIMADMETLRVQEANLRTYETRLRETIPPMGAAQNSRAPFASDSIEAEWEKIRRSRTLFEAERRSLIDERARFREQEADLKQGMEALRQRAAWVEKRERELMAKSSEPPPPPPPPPAAKPSFTRAPFAAAKSMLSFRSAS